MCGFSLININPLSSKGNELDKIEKSLKLIQHRGPDNQQIWANKNKEIIMAHARLSIIDLDFGSQPFQDITNRYTIVFNGEIYNYKEIKETLNLKTRTNSDTEVLLLGYIRLKENILKLIKGMFSFCIWDNQEKNLFVARDRFGIKPLYYTKYQSSIILSSEIKGLLPFIIKKEINKDALSDYFNFQLCLDNRTLFKNIYEFPKASFSLIKNGELNKVNKYWKLNYEIDLTHNEEWFSEKLKELMNKSISLNCTADVPIATYMSGGIDSTLISLLSKDLRNTNYPQIFTGRYTSHEGYDESDYVKKACNGTNLNVNIVTINPQDFVNNFQKLIWHLDQPMAGPGSFGQFMVSKKASETHKVILGGQGGDEIFGGYARYLIAYLEICLNESITNRNNIFSDNISLTDILPSLKTLDTYKPLLKEFLKFGLFDNFNERYWHLINRSASYKGLISFDYLNNEETRKSFNSLFFSIKSSESPLNKMCNFDINTLLTSLLHIEDRVSMAHGLEARVPFLDHELVTLVSNIPTRIKFKNGDLKTLLKSTFKSNIPSIILNRKDKMGFPIPINKWIKENKSVNEFVLDIFRSNNARQRHYFNQKLDIESMINSETNYSRSFWSILNLEIWQRKYID